MPPSGYNKIQSQSLISFLKSCSQSLKLESIERNETIAHSLQRETKDIQNYLQLKNDEGITDYLKARIELRLNDPLKNFINGLL